MWPVTLNMTSDDCRRTLRSLELEAYSNMISVFRAQGPLEDTRKKLLEDLRGVLHISSDRHSAEARRVANDELLATIAEQLVGPNTDQAWKSEGRRLIPLMPRGVPQTMYTEIADKVARAAAMENKEILKKIKAEKLAPKQEPTEAPKEPVDTTDELVYPPIVMEDLSVKLWEENLNRKRKMTDSTSVTDESSAPPVKNTKNPTNTPKYLDVGNLYKISQPVVTSKASGQSKHSYNQVSKVSTSKTQQGQRTPERRGTKQHRTHKQNKHPSQNPRPSSKKSQEVLVSPTKYNIMSPQRDYCVSPGSFQASYAQSLMGKPRCDYIEDMKIKGSGVPDQQPASLPHEQIHDTGPKFTTGKPCQVVIKKKGNVALDKTLNMSDIKILQKQSEKITVTSNRQVVVAPSSTPKHFNTTGKMVPTKIISSVPKPQSTPMMSEKMIVVSKPDQRALSASRVLSFSSPATGHRETVPNIHTPKPLTESIVAKCIPASDLKVSAKTYLLNPKSGQKMVVLPGKPKVKTSEMPMMHFKGLPPTMKIVPASSHAQIAKTPLAKPTVVNTVIPLSSPKVSGVEAIKTANMADITPVKGLTHIPITNSKLNPVIRPSTGKGSVIVVQKGTTIGKTLSFTKNSNDVSKIIMGKNMNQLLQASNFHKQEQLGKTPNNVIVLELNNDQSARATTMSKIIDDHETTENKDDVLNSSFDSPADNSMDSANSIDEISAMEEAELLADKPEDSGRNKDSSVDWEMDLEPKELKDDEDKINSDRHVDLGMSSESDVEYAVSGHKPKSKMSPNRSSQPIISTGVNNELFDAPGLTLASRTLLSQLQDDGSSSNDSSFTLKSKMNEKLHKPEGDKETEALNKAKEKLSEKVAEEKSQQKRIDIYSTAISSSDINLDSFSYLEDGMIEMFDTKCRDSGKELDLQLSQLLGDAGESADFSLNK